MLTRRPLSVALATAAILAMSVASGAAEPIGVWVPGPPMADARESHTATVLKDGRVLVVSAQAEEYDPVGNRWLPAGTPPITLTNKTATLLDDGRVLLVGGIDTTTGRSVPNAELYDPTANTWTPAASMAGRRYDHTATLLRDGRVLIAGGTRSSVVLDSVEIYDPKTNAWSPAASLPTPRSEHIAARVQDERVLVAGGNGSSGTTLATAELYDPATNRWSATSPMAVARRFLSATATPLKDGSILVVGGLPGPLPQASEASAEIFRSETETWNSAGYASQPLVSDGLAATILRDGRILICGGASPTLGAMASGFIYDPGLDRWFPTSQMSRGRVYHSASLLPTGRVLVAGGRDAYSNGTPLNTTEIFDYPAASSPVAISPNIAQPTETVGSRWMIAPLVAGGIAVIALVLITPPILRRWRRRRGI